MDNNRVDEAANAQDCTNEMCFAWTEATKVKPLAYFSPGSRRSTISIKHKCTGLQSLQQALQQAAFSAILTNNIKSAFTVLMLRKNTET